MTGFQPENNMDKQIEYQIRQIIKQELDKFKDKNLSFRSWIIADTPTDSYSVGNKLSGNDSYLAKTGGEITGNLRIDGSVGFYGTAATGKQTITGSRAGNAALADLLTKLATIGLITDSSS